MLLELLAEMDPGVATASPAAPAVTPAAVAPATVAPADAKRAAGIAAERLKIAEQIKADKAERARIRAQMQADRSNTATRELRTSRAQLPAGGGANINRYGDIGVDLNSGGG